MDTEVKQRNRRRKRAQRMQAQRQSQKVTSLKDGDSENDGSPIREKPQRPPIRRKKSKEPLVEEDIIDGFAILGFRSYDDLEAVIKLASKAGIRRLTSNVVEEKLKTEKESQRNLSITNNHHHHHHHHHISALPPTVVVTHQNPGLTLTHDPGTSDDSGRASERLTGSSVAPRDPDSSRDRLSDASSRCSSGKGYICDSEGEDDKGSDAGSVLFASTPSARKLDFPSALSISNGDTTTPVSVSAPTPPSLQPPAPSPTAAALPPPQPQYSCPPSSAAITAHTPPRLPTPPPIAAAPIAVVPPTSVPVTMPQPAAAAAPAPAAHLAPALDSTPDVNRTDSPAVATSATNVAVAPGSTGQYSAFPSLYAPYASSPYTAPSPAAVTLTASPRPPSTTSSACVPPGVSTVATVTTVAATSHRDTITSARTHSPRGHSPTRERDSYSSNVSSLSRGSVTPFSSAPSTIAVSSSLTFSKPVQQQATVAGWPPQGGATPTNSAPPSQLSPAPPRPTPPLQQNMHSFPAPMFAPPLPPPVSTASPLGLPQNQVPNPNPFSAESLFQSNQTDMLRRELDSRFLASQDRSINVGPPPYLRTEMHQHQHHHTHVHQHTTPLLPPPPSNTLFPTPMQFKEIPKMGSVDSPFYRQNIGIGSYPGYSPGLLHPGISGSTPFVPPNHLPPFQPKQPMGDAPKPKPTMKTGKWNAMHVRVAWEIYHHQQKQQSEVKAGAKADLLRPPSHMFPGSLIHSGRPHEMFPPNLATHRPPGFDHQPHPGSLFSNPPSHLVVNGTAGSGISPFTRYGTAFNAPGSPFSMSPFPSARDMPPMGPLHDPWGRLQRFPPAPVPQPPWGLKPDPAVLERREQEERERERERERLRREREDRERREREEKQRKQLEQQQQERERERERREKERREHERREMERERERERERMLHQQRIQESKQHAAAAAMAARDRSPLHNGDQHEVRVKEEPRSKDDDVVMLTRTDHRDHRFHPYLNRHPQSPMHTMLDRSRGMLPPGLGGPMPSHFPPPPSSHWPGPDPFRDPYRFEPLRYNPLMEAAMRVEEERAKMFNAYANHTAHMRAKEAGPPPGMMHMRGGPGPGPGPPPPPQVDMQHVHKKDDSSQSR